METKKIAVSLAALILTAGCLGGKEDVETQRSTGETTIKEGSGRMMHPGNNTWR